MGPDELLFWLSARREGSWGQFRSAVEEILAEGTNQHSYQDMRFVLEQMGHVEFEGRDEGGGWRVAPPILAVSQRAGGYVGIVCGARSRQLVARMRTLDGPHPEISASDSYPSVIRYQGDELAVLARTAADAGLGIQTDAPVRILSCAERIETLAHSRPTQLPFGKDFEVSHFVIGRTCRWASSSDSEAAREADGLYRFVRFQIPQHYLKLGGRALRVDGQTAKFFLLARRRRQVLKYDRLTRMLSLPGICRPPLLIDRALALCSGYPATYNPGRRMLTYAEIGEDVAGFAASLLSQRGL